MACDLVVERIRDHRLLEAIMLEYPPLPESTIGGLMTSFDFVHGRTAQEPEDGADSA